MEDMIRPEPKTKTIQSVAPAAQNSTRLMVLIIILALLLCATSVIAWVLYKEKKQNDIVLRIDDKKTIIINVAKHVRLPEGEEPVFATVTDPKQLSDQPFFQYALAGDKVLVYSSIKRAILYRPSIDRIIEMIPYDPAAGAPIK